mgnify:CR=1 FL=1
MKIALAQLNYTVGDVAGNTNKIIESVRRAKAEGKDLAQVRGLSLQMNGKRDLHSFKGFCCGKILFWNSAKMR